MDVHNGLFYNGGFYLLGIQLLEIISIFIWSMIMSYIFFKLIDLTIGLRISKEEELLGLDLVYHTIDNIDICIDIKKEESIELENQNKIDPIRKKIINSLKQVDNYIDNLPNQVSD